MAEYIKTTDAIITTWMILRGMGYAAEDNPDMVKTVSAVFDTAPAADVVEVRHGMWLRTPTGWVYCSVCGEEPPEETNARTKYCPNCGAKMDGGQDE